MTNKEYLIMALTEQFDDCRATFEAEVYYHINCPYFEGDKRCECRDKPMNWETCVICKTKWLDSEVDE